MNNEFSCSTRFKKGIIPWNKGKKGIMPVPWNKGKKIGFVPKFAFQKGHETWNKGKNIQTNTGRTHFKKGEHPSPTTEFKKGEHIGNKHPNWKGGKRITIQGYLLEYSPSHPSKTLNETVLQHRLIMEKKIGRFLTPKEVVHHINEDTLNNDSKNLMLFENNAQHMMFHRIVNRLYNNQFQNELIEIK